MIHETENVVPIRPWRGLGRFDGTLVVEGPGAYVDIGEGSVVSGTLIVRGENSRIVIGEGCKLVDVHFEIGTAEGEIKLGDDVLAGRSGLHVREPGAIVVFDRALLGIECWISNSDFHPVFDTQTGERLNSPRDVIVGDGAWIGLRAIVLKGSQIGAHSIVGAGAVVSGSIPPNVLAVGNPARPVRENVVAGRDLPY